MMADLKTSHKSAIINRQSSISRVHAMLTILSLLAHPDDAELLCAGALIRLRQEHNAQVHIATMTPGDCGSAEYPPAEISHMRRDEAARAAALIDAQYHCLEERDLLIFYSEATMEKVTRLLRMVQPNIVLTHSPSDYMLDHEVTSTLTRAACFAAPIPNFLPACDLGDPLPHIPHLYYCDPIEGKDPLGNAVVPAFHVDISRVIDSKTAMLACHASQRSWLLKHHGMDQYTQAMREFSAHCGRAAGVAFAEGFRQHLGHSYPQDNVLGKLLLPP
jgi:LmbE family N-acetylglucosaminyl deacetylase